MQITTQCTECKQAKDGLNRRNFLNMLGWGSISAFFVGLGGVSLRFLIPNRVGPSKNAFVAGRLEEFSQKVTYVTGRRAFIVRDDNGMRALSAVCTHLGCTVNWIPENDRIECPCHGSIFDEETGAVLRGPATRPLEWYKVTALDNGQLLVDPDDPVDSSYILPV